MTLATLPPKRNARGYDVYCHVCWEEVYILWVDDEPPDYDSCPLGPYTAQSCPNAVAGAHRAKLTHDVDKRALELWQAREMELDPRLRRMEPDDIDHASGAWAAVRQQALMDVLFGRNASQDVGTDSPSLRPTGGGGA